jgi:predicted CoA-binding protein
MRYLQRVGYRCIPINPNADEVLGERCYASLADLPEPVDLVDVFRRAEYCADVAREAAAIGAPALWLQLGLRSAEARDVAEETGMEYVEDACTAVVHRRL